MEERTVKDWLDICQRCAEFWRFRSEYRKNLKVSISLEYNPMHFSSIGELPFWSAIATVENDSCQRSVLARFTRRTEIFALKDLIFDLCGWGEGPATDETSYEELDLKLSSYGF